jgi:peptidoglycan/LPS O-acetylase OafA/YrhL
VKQRQIVGLDLIRFGAALLVMSYHLLYKSRQVPSLYPATWFGWIGVDIFFVLSGFVIAYTADGASASTFLKQRIVRLVPAAWICATICVAIWPDMIGYLHAVTFWPWPPWIDGAYWTLGVEISFYALIWALLACGRFAALPKVLIALGIASTGYWTAKAAWAVLTGSALLPIIDHLPGRPMQLLLLEQGCFFAIGGLLWLCLTKEASWQRWLAILICTGGGVLAVMGAGLREARAFGGASLIAWPILVWLAAIGLIIVSVRYNDRLRRLIRPKLARSLGLATYPLYLLHTIVGFAAIFVLADRTAAAPAVAVALSLGAAFLVSGWLEPALQRVFRAVLKMPKARTEQVAASEP